MYDSYAEILKDLEQNSHLRSVKNFTAKDEKYIYFAEKRYLNLSSNNYLAFADNRRITDEFLKSTGSRYSFGSASARLLTGTLPIYNDLENLISDLYGKESTLLFNSGYHANVGVSGSIAKKGDAIFSDKLNHASIIDGMQLSGAKFFRYLHNDVKNLEQLLERERKNYNNAVIITESVFGMDGDIADLKKIVSLKRKYNCILVVDEAHAFGVFGKKGLGICETAGVIKDIDLIVGTFGKAIGSMGAFVCGSKVLTDFLTNKARPFIFSTSLPPINVAFTKWIIENKLPGTYEKRMKMLEIAKNIHSESHIIPVVIGDNKSTIDMCDKLFQSGYFTLPIRPPAVPEGTSRLRLSLNTSVTEKDLEKLCSIIG